MKKTTLPCALTCALSYFAICASLSAEWQPLFDGESLEGWRQLGGEADYRVEDGAIVGTSVLNTPNSFLATERDYGDFILEFEYKLDDGLNSGVQFRSLSVPEFRNGRVHGYQYELETSSRAWTAGIYDEARRGWIYPGSFNPAAGDLYRAGEWNQARIECVGPEIRTFLNGQPVAYLVDEETASGLIGLQVHSIGRAEQEGKQVRWRNIRIDTDVKSVSRGGKAIYIRNMIPNTLTDLQRKQGWQSLFDGERTVGLVGLGSDSFPEKGWVPQDGVLKLEGSKYSPIRLGGDIVTEREYGAFEFECEFKLTEKANSGIKYFVTDYENVENGGTSLLGLEYQLLDDENHPDAKNGRDGNRTCASLYDLIPAADRVHNRAVSASVGEWNHARIVARPDGSVEHWLNGFKVLEYRRGSDAYRALVGASKYRDFKDFGEARKGRLLLQDHSDEVHFRSLRVREL